MYLIYKEDSGRVTLITDVISSNLKQGLKQLKNEDFELNDLEKYNIVINSDGSILSQLKPLAERKAIQLEKKNQTLSQQLFQSQTELLQTQLEKADSEQRLFHLETQLLSKGVIE